MSDRISRGALALSLVLVTTSAVWAQQAPAPAPPPPAAPPEPLAPQPETVGVTPTVSVEAAAVPRSVLYGAALRGRWISVPSWFLGLFTKKNVPLSSFGVGGEFFRRKGDLDISLGIGWQKMGPPDGNWLGRGKQAAIDTDYVQFRNFGLIGFDASFLWRTEINQHVAFRYGAGLGVAIVTGKMYRISAGGCTEQNAGNLAECFPRVAGCTAGPCPEKALKDSEGRPDNGPMDPHRFVEDDVPGAIPIINLLLGFDFHIPDVKGLELRLEGGWYDAFFVGLAAGYLF